MENTHWIIPAVILLFILGKIAEALRIMRGSLEEDLSFLRVAIGDVQRLLSKAPQSEDRAIPSAVLVRANALLAQASQSASTCPGDVCLPGMTWLQRLAVRKQVKQALKKVSLARSLIRPFGSDEPDTD